MELHSTAKEISTWFIQADFKAEVGYEYTFTHESTQIKGHVLEASPFHTLIYTWIVGGTGVETTVSGSLKKTQTARFSSLSTRVYLITPQKKWQQICSAVSRRAGARA